MYLSSELAGGNFWDGFRQGVITSGLNHLAHATADGLSEPPHVKRFKKMLKKWRKDFQKAIKSIPDYTYETPVDFIGAGVDFAKSYIEMIETNFANSDKYFHSKANFNATRRGPAGEFFAKYFSNLRESYDMYIKGDSYFQSMQDQKANIYGRTQGLQYRNWTGQIDYSLAIPLYRTNRLLIQSDY